jgi:amino acid transporter
VATIVLIKVISGDTPGNQSFTLDVFSPPSGSGIGDVFKGAVFGFLSFAGFEAAATLGEETREPRRAIPRAILGTAIFGGIYFVYVTAVEVMGFGTDAKGMAAFYASGSLLGDLGNAYVASWIGDIVTLGTAISAFACILACVVGATRVLYALSRDGFGTQGLGVVHSRTGTPVRALGTICGVAAIVILADRILFTSDPFDVFIWSGVIGTLILLVAYLLATAGAMRMLWFRGAHLVPAWQMVVPILGALVLIATLYFNLDFDAARATRWNYYTAAIWLAIGVVIILALPGLSRRVGDKLAADEGLVESDSGGAAVPAD